MRNAGAFGIIIQLRQELVADLLLSLLSDPMTTEQMSGSYIPRQIIQPDPPEGIMLWWDQPEVTFDDDNHVMLSVYIAGGVRQLESGCIFSINGPVAAQAAPTVKHDAYGMPYLGLNLTLLDLNRLHITYADLQAPPPEAIEVQDEESLLAGVLRDQLMARLAQLPLSCGCPLLQTYGVSGSAHVFGSAAGNAATLAFMPTRAAERALPEDVLSDHATSNVALKLTAEGVNQVIKQQLVANIIPRSLQGQDGTELARIESLSVEFHNRYVTLFGHVSRGDLSANVSVDLALSLDERGQLVVVTEDMHTDSGTLPKIAATPNLTPTYDQAFEAVNAATNIVARSYGSIVLRSVLGDTGNADAIDLTQRFTVPTTPLVVDVAPDELLVTEGALTIYYSIPYMHAEFTPEPPAHAPEVLITQPVVPTPVAAATPVSATVRATLVTESYPPYDYIWKTELASPMQFERGPTLAVTGYPSGASNPQEQGHDRELLTHAQVTIIDGFGQVTQHSAPVWVQAVRRELAPVPELGDSFDLLPPRPTLHPTVPTDPFARSADRSGVLTLPQLMRKPHWKLFALLMLVILLCAGSGLYALIGIINPNASDPLFGSGSAPFSRSTVTPSSTMTANDTTHSTAIGVPPASGTPQMTPGVSQTTTGTPQATATGTISAPTPTNTPPTISFTAQPTNKSQSCGLFGSGSPGSYNITLDNSQSSVAVTWQITITQTAPGAAEPWASASPASGTVPAGMKGTITINPASDLCSRLQRNTTFHAPIAWNAAASGATIDVTDTVSPPTL